MTHNTIADSNWTILGKLSASMNMLHASLKVAQLMYYSSTTLNKMSVLTLKRNISMVSFPNTSRSSSYLNATVARTLLSCTTVTSKQCYLSWINGNNVAKSSLSRTNWRIQASQSSHGRNESKNKPIQSSLTWGKSLTRLMWDWTGTSTPSRSTIAMYGRTDRNSYHSRRCRTRIGGHLCII